ncbi:CDP-glycerol glycerophosphotransferase family protein [Arthrobacter sp. Sa2CUA1]|uniref:CDP-glycerol glycerophosphotransferase family protein n=1 Tax=Arthrobacter gallicola TaxID=2762225 RepID=A0ABR8UPI6_9MICC|nr:CDP-glycerol glycerophosphotransferase family protein [Arthrobacter gallicola]MBD7994478.1 CDP-glycerol glycerophosphotransferase family protein [Arthrobacter gallicola]
MRSLGIKSVLGPLGRKGRALAAGRLRKSPQAPGHGLLSLVLLPGGNPGAAQQTAAALLNQRYGELEVIVSRAEAQVAGPLHELAGSEPRLRLVTSAHGVGAALAAASGEFVALVEPGTLPDAGLYNALLDVLAPSGADFAGAISAAPKSSIDRHVVRLPPQSLTGRTLAAFPAALADGVIWTKLYRRRFLAEILGGLPAETTVEEIVARGFLGAESFDYVITATGASAPQDTWGSVQEELAELLSRARRLTGAIPSGAPEEAVASWFAASFGARWAGFAREVPRHGPDFWTAMQDAARLLAATPGALDSFPLHDRILVALAADGQLNDFRTVLAEIQDKGRGYRVSEDPDGAFHGQPVYLPLLNFRVPTELLAIQPVDLGLQSRLRGFVWLGTTLRFTGFAYLRGIAPEQTGFRVFLSDPSSGRRIPLPVQRLQDDSINETTGDRWNDYAEAGFSAEIDAENVLHTLAADGGGGRPWYVELELSTRGVTVVERLMVRDEDCVPGRLPVGPAVGRRRLVSQFDRVHGLRFSMVSYRYTAEPAELESGIISLTFQGEVPHAVVAETAGQSPVSFRAHPGNPAVFTTELAGLVPSGSNGDEITFQLRAGNSSSLHHVGLSVASDETNAAPDAPVRTGSTGFGFITLTTGQPRLAVSDWALTAENLVLTLIRAGTHAQDGVSLALVGPQTTITADSVKVSPDSVVLEASFRLLHDRWGAGSAFPPYGRYRLVELVGNETHAVGVSSSLAGAGLGSTQDRLRAVTPAFSPGQQFQLRLLPPLGTAERGAHNQQRLIDGYRTVTEPIAEDLVLFETFGGKAATDSGWALSNELGVQRPRMRKYWSVANASFPVPAGCLPLQRYSAEWFRVLGTAKYLVNNNDFPVFFRKRPGQIYIQTWHGTPLKRIGFDTPRERLTPSYLRTLEREPRDWDVLLAQSPYAAQVLASAFRYDGPVAVLGYPRNDALKSPRASAERQRVRALLGIPPEDTVLLYAPTWRDNALTSGGKLMAVNHLDLAEVRAALGNNYSVLFRGHHNVAEQRSGTTLNGLIDVTDYPQISDLCLAADILVTDYSSIMFDFAVTGKPMFFLVPDLEDYRDSVRGFYFDFEAQAPGPLVRDQKELCARLGDYSPADWQAKYSRFTQTYAPDDDGGAAARLLQSILIPGHT